LRRPAIEKADVLKQLAEKRFEYFAAMGLSPVKCRQLVTEKMHYWQKLTAEELAGILAREEFGS